MMKKLIVFSLCAVISLAVLTACTRTDEMISSEEENISEEKSDEGSATEVLGNEQDDEMEISKDQEPSKGNVVVQDSNGNDITFYLGMPYSMAKEQIINMGYDYDIQDTYAIGNSQILIDSTVTEYTPSEFMQWDAITPVTHIYVRGDTSTVKGLQQFDSTDTLFELYGDNYSIYHGIDSYTRNEETGYYDVPDAEEFEYNHFEYTRDNYYFWGQEYITYDSIFTWGISTNPFIDNSYYKDMIVLYQFVKH